MKKLALLFVLLCFFEAKAQERLLLSGQVIKQDSLMENVHVQNVTTSKYAITDKEGFFTLNGKPGDTLLLSHVNAVDLVKILRNDDFEAPIVIRFKESNHELEEVILDERSRIDAVSLGIIPKKIEKLTINERRLKTAGDFKPIHLLALLGGSLQIDPILNALSGRTKKLKRNISIEQKLQNISILEGYSDYMLKEMALTEKEVPMLIRYAVEEDDVQLILDSKNDAAIKFFLQDVWRKLKNERP